MILKSFVTPPVSERSEQNQCLLAGAKRLLARATDSRAVDLDVLVSRIKAAVEKYLWNDDENASEATVAQFIDELQADDQV